MLHSGTLRSYGPIILGLGPVWDCNGGQEKVGVWAGCEEMIIYQLVPDQFRLRTVFKGD